MGRCPVGARRHTTRNGSRYGGTRYRGARQDAASGRYGLRLICTRGNGLGHDIHIRPSSSLLHVHLRRIDVSRRGPAPAAACSIPMARIRARCDAAWVLAQGKSGPDGKY